MLSFSIMDNFAANLTSFRLSSRTIARNNSQSRPLLERSRSASNLQEQGVENEGVTLIVGYEQILRAGLQELLQISGLEAITANTGDEAIYKLQAHLQEIKVVLLDTHYAGMNAVTTLDALCKLKPSLKVILCSSAEPKEMAQQFAALPIAVYLRKPFETELLLNHLNTLLG